jgi:hypothetical protein
MVIAWTSTNLTQFDDDNRRADNLLRKLKLPAGESNDSPAIEPIWKKRTNDWANWLKGEIAVALRAHGEMVIDIVAEEHNKLNDRLRAEIKTLEADIGALKAELALLKSVQKVEVAQLIKRSGDVA